ncbi:Cell death protease, partial [Dissophora globulifera]
SSADGYFLESGPLRFVDKKLTINSGGWHEFANIVFLDQPVGTGLSYTTQPLLQSLEEITNHFLAFLKAFYAIFPERAQDELYLAGESYAGTYIPYFAKGILDHNALASKQTTYNLKGIAIGNGWIDPLHQYTSYIPYVTQHNIATPDLLDALVTQQDRCLDDIRADDRITQYKCEELVQLILQHSVTGDDTPQCTNQYDVRLQDSYPSCGLLWPYELPLMKEYLTRPDVLEALHAKGAQEQWTECSTRVSQSLRYDNSSPSVSLLPGILEKLNVLLFSGDADLICNHIGTEYLISNMTWQGVQGFQNAPDIRWTIEGEPSGVWRQERNLTYVLLYNASHMVPYDTPLAALDMMNRFMGLDHRLQSFTSKLDTDLSEGQLPPGGEVVDIDQPERSIPSYGSAVLLFLVLAVGVGAFMFMKNQQRQRKLGGHDGVQWFPLNNPYNRERELVHTDDLDELVVEGGIHDSDDDEDDNDAFGSQDAQTRRPFSLRR